MKNLTLHEIPNETSEQLKTMSKEEIDQSNIESIELELQNALKTVKNAKPNLTVIQVNIKKIINWRNR